MLENENLQGLLREQGELTYIESDPLFDESKNCDYSHRHNGILKENFARRFEGFLECCRFVEGIDVREQLMKGRS